MNRVQKNIVANLLGNLWVGLMSIAFIPLYIKYLGIESYGLIGVFAALQSWLVLLDLGLTQTLSREMARFHGGEHTKTSIRNLLFSIECIYVFLAIGIAVIWHLSSPWISENWLKIEDLPLEVVVQSLQITALVVVFRWMGGLYKGALLGLQNQIQLNIIVSIFATLKGVGVVFVLAYIEPSVLLFFQFQGVVAFIEFIVLYGCLRIALPSTDSISFSVHELKKVWKFAGGILLITGLALLLTQVDKLLLSHLLPLREFGYYTLAGAVAGALYQFVNPISGAVSPRLVQLVAEDNFQVLTEDYHRYSQYLTLSLVPAGCVLIFFSQHLLMLWTRNPAIVSQASFLLSLLVVGIVLNGLMHMPYLLQLAYGRTELTILANSFAVLVLVPAIYLVTPVYGAVGAAWIWVVLNAGYVLLVVPLMHKKILPNEKWRWYFQDVIPIAITAFTVAGIIRWFAPEPELNAVGRDLGWLVFASILTFLCSLLCLFVIRLMLGKPKVIVMIQGGLGNQLFCYAFARALSLRNGCDLNLDGVTGFVRDHVYQRKYSLQHFSIHASFVNGGVGTVLQTKLVRYLIRVCCNFIPLAVRPYILQNNMDFNPKYMDLRIRGPVYLEGYWQSELYFKDYESVIRDDLKFTVEFDEVNLQMASQIRDCLSVSLHVRWFDQLENEHAGGHNVSCNYYSKAVQLMEERLDSPHYFVFSDDPEAAKNRVSLPLNRTTFLSINMEQDVAFKDLWLMSQCQHNIVANSTFSWWGAWLNANPNKIVVAPNVILEGKMAWGFKGLLPEEWIKV